MASFTKQAFIYIVAAGTLAESVRHVLEEQDEALAASRGDWPAKLIGVDPEALWEEYHNALYPYLQKDLMFLKRVRLADPELFAEKFKDASVGRYVKVTKQKKAQESFVNGMIAALGTILPLTEGAEALRAGRTVAQWIAESYTWKQWLSKGKGEVLEKGQDASLRYVSDATMGNLWEAMLNVNAIQLAPKGGESIPVFERKAREYTDYTLPENTVLTPISVSATRLGGEKSIFVAWEDKRKLMSAFVKDEHVIPSLFSATSVIDLVAFPSQDAPKVGGLSAGEIFAVSRNVQDESGTWWMQLSDGRGYALKDTTGYKCAHQESKAAPEGNAAMKAGWELDQSVSWRCSRLAFNVGMFAAGFFTSGATWVVAAGVNTVHVGGRAVLEQSAMSDLDMKMELLVMQLRAWELRMAHFGHSCHVSKEPCSEPYKCIRELAFFDGDLGGEPGSGRCMLSSELPTLPDGEACLVHADCDSGNCEPAPGCKGRACLDATCKPFADR